MIKNSVVQNAKWMVICRIAQSLIQLVIGMITARYLGPSNYGLINYVASIVAFVVPIMQLGMTATLVQEYITRPEEEGEVMGTSFLMSCISSLACVVGVISFVAVANCNEKDTIMVAMLYSISVIFQTTELLQYWFQAKLLSKYSSIATLIAYVVVSGYKIFLLASGKSVFWFALSHAVEYAFSGGLFFAVYCYKGGSRPSFSWNLAKAIFAKSKYYIISGLMITVFQNTDHVMLKMMMGNLENGYYTTAITCATVTQFVFRAIIDSARPIILKAEKDSEEVYGQKISNLYTVIIYITTIQAVVFMVMATPMVRILYGQEYLPSVPVLRIIVWQQPFAFIGAVRNIWILKNEKYNLNWRINLCGVVANILLNAAMIPLWGACGAALASVLTQIFTNFLVGFIIPAIRPNNRLLLQGLNPRNLVDILRKIR